MMKYAKIFFLFCFLFLGAVACKKQQLKKKLKDELKNLPSGKYTGVFVFDSLPELNFTKEFVGVKSYVYNSKNRHGYIKYDFFNISDLDTSQFQIEFDYRDDDPQGNDNDAYVLMLGKYVTSYDIFASSNNIIGGKTYDYGSYAPDSFTLTYTP